MDSAPIPIGAVQDSHVMTPQGWVMLGTMQNGHVMTSQGWVVLGTVQNGHIATPGGWVKHNSPAGRLGVALAIGGAGLLIGLVGLVMSNASVSLLSGTGTNWTGAGLAIIACVSSTLALFLLKAPLWTTIVTGSIGALLAGLALVCVVYYEVQLEDRRQEFSDTFDGAPFRASQR